MKENNQCTKGIIYAYYFIRFYKPNTGRDYCKTSNISRTLVGNTIVENSDVVGTSPVGAAPTTSSFST